MTIFVGLVLFIVVLVIVVQPERLAQRSPALGSGASGELKGLVVERIGRYPEGPLPLGGVALVKHDAAAVAVAARQQRISKGSARVDRAAARPLDVAVSPVSVSGSAADDRSRTYRRRLDSLPIPRNTVVSHSQPLGQRQVEYQYHLALPKLEGIEVLCPNDSLMNKHPTAFV